MKQTWRWFGPHDKATIEDIVQAGAQAVVTALHHIPYGDVWTIQEISRRQQQVARRRDGSPSGLAWEVVESLPVSEAVKKQQGDWRAHIAAYQTSLRNLARAGIKVVCYNFMPVLDWTRTELRHRLPSGARTMRFDLTDFAAFDLHILNRRDAVVDYPDAMREEATRRFRIMDDSRRAELVASITMGLPGDAGKLTIDEVRAQLEGYRDISADRLRKHFIDFLAEIVPVAEELGMRLCCHPDDPPFPLLGLPRIMSTEADYAFITDAVNSPANGLTLCSGSLGARPDNDLPGMMQRLGHKVHFLHLRNVKRESTGLLGSFFEAEHLNGDTDMVTLIAAIIAEERRRRAEGRDDVDIPMRPDHGQEIIDDLDRGAQPGYPVIGRLKGLAELRGVIRALEHT